VAAWHLWGWWGFWLYLGLQGTDWQTANARLKAQEDLKAAGNVLDAARKAAKQHVAQAENQETLIDRYERAKGIRQKPGQN